MIIAKSHVPSLKENIIVEQMEQDLMLYDTDQGQAVSLNSSSSLILTLCDGDNTIANIIDEISEIYPDNDHPILENEILKALEELQISGILSFS